MTLLQSVISRNVKPTHAGVITVRGWTLLLLGCGMTLVALWLAADGLPDPLVLTVFVLGVILMRSAGCAINDFADRHIPAELFSATEPNCSEESYHDWYIQRRIGGLGLIWNKAGPCRTG